MKYPLPSTQESQELIEKLTAPEYKLDFLKLAMMAWPWGEPDTPLHEFKEPEIWQCDELEKMSIHVQEDILRVHRGEEPQIYKSATCSGHGTGKGALTGMITCMYMATRWGATVITAANKEDQLRYKTWAEIRKWQQMSVFRHMFECDGMIMRPASWFATQLKEQYNIDDGYYYAKGELWSKENPGAFAGTHNRKGVCTIFDEASDIYAKVWEISEGYMTDSVLNRFFFAWSNGRRNTGRFFDCFHKYKGLYHLRNLDSRAVRLTDKQYLKNIIDQYGEDSDQVKTMVKGQFPSLGDDQLIGLTDIQNAYERELFEDKYAAAILGIDPARSGKNKTVLQWRIGRDARSLPVIERQGFDTEQVYQLIIAEVERVRRLGNLKAHQIHICIDAGQGTGIYDRLVHTGYQNLKLVWFSSPSPDPQYFDMRTYLWAKTRDWLKTGGCITKTDQQLHDDLMAPELQKWQGGEIRKLESKEDMQTRGVKSPDHGDALAVTMAVDPLPLDIDARSQHDGTRGPRVAHGSDYDIFRRYR